MMYKVLPRLSLLLVLSSVLPGCAHPSTPLPESRVTTPAAITEASTTRAATTQAARWETLRIATAADLELRLSTRVDPKDHFLVCVVKVYNASGGDVILDYEPLSATVHCGQYEQRGPAVTFVHRREVLRPQQALELEIPPGGWVPSPTATEQDLMIPTELPPGTYPVWATFHLPTDSATIDSGRDSYTVK